jgi:DNA polymerase III subunit delta
MTPEQAIAEAEAGELRPVYLVLGEEQLLVDRVLGALRHAAVEGGIAGFNEDKFTAGEASIDVVMAAAKSLPMMAPRRLVLVRGLDRWEKKEGDDEAAPARAPKKGIAPLTPLDALAEYTKDPSPTTVLVLVAPKLHAQRRVVSAAKKGGFVVSCEPLHRRELPGWIRASARDRGHPIAEDVADHLAELAGPELASVNDAIERLSLYVGPKQAITDEAVAAVVTRVRQSTVWELLDALSRRRLDRALAALGDVYDQRDGGLRLLGSIGWSVRQMVKFESALRAGANPAEAAQRAGMPPFKANEVSQTLRSMPPGTLATWLALLAEADLALKGSKRAAPAVLETMLIDMCGGSVVAGAKARAAPGPSPRRA